MKTIIIQLDFGGTDYYVKVGDTEWIETYNPYEATEFTSVKEARNWINSNTTVAEDAKFINPLDAKLKFDKWYEGGMVRRKFPLVDKTLSRSYKNESPDEVLEWWIAQQRADENAVRYEDYSTWPQLYEVFKCLHSVRSYHTKDYSGLNHTFQLCIKKDSDFKTFLTELKKVINHVDYLDEQGGKVFDIFDRFLSAGGNSVDLIVYDTKKDGRAAVVNRYGNNICGSLKDCFEYLKRERYYE